MYKAFGFIKSQEHHHEEKSTLEYLFMSIPSWLVYIVYWYITKKKENDV